MCAFLSKNSINLERNAFSSGAYAFALNNDTAEANQLLDLVEALAIHLNENQKCFKLTRKHDSCDYIHTSYAAMAYLTMNEIKKARPLVVWLTESYNLNKFRLNTQLFAISTEVIAKLLSSIPERDVKLSVNIRNEESFDKTELITKKNAHLPFEIELPDYSLESRTSISGEGFCSITTMKMT